MQEIKLILPSELLGGFFQNFKNLSQLKRTDQIKAQQILIDLIEELVRQPENARRVLRDIEETIQGKNLMARYQQLNPQSRAKQQQISRGFFQLIQNPVIL